MNKYTMHKVYLLKVLLTSNIYLLALFPVLLQNGFSKQEIVFAISIGTAFMIAGDLMSSLAVDLLGPKLPVLIGAIIQAVSIGTVPFCTTQSSLIIAEIFIGLSFPVIAGADSKWLNYVCGPKFSERMNQGLFF